MSKEIIKRVPVSVLGLLLVFGLTGCVPTEGEAQLEKGSPIEKVKVKTAVEGEYKVGDKIIKMMVESYQMAYYFGGFVDEDTFVINVSRSSGNFNESFSIYYTIERNMDILLPSSNTIVQLKDFSISEGTITLEK